MAELNYIDVNGDRIAYRDQGDGETLLLVHGVTGNSATWRELLPRLAADFRVIAPDLLGHGESDKPHSDYSLGGLASWLRDFMDAMQISRATVVGQSLGGAIAMQFAYQHRSRCERLVLIDSGGLEPELSWPLRMLSAPGAELLLPVVAPQPVLDVGNRIRSLINAAGVHSPAGAEFWNTYSSMADGATRSASLSGGLPRSGRRGDEPAAPGGAAADPADLGRTGLGGSGVARPCRTRGHARQPTDGAGRCRALPARRIARRGRRHHPRFRRDHRTTLRADHPLLIRGDS